MDVYAIHDDKHIQRAPNQYISFGDCVKDVLNA